MKKLISSLILVGLIVLPAFAQDITGQWNGALKVQGTQLRIVFHIEKSNEGFSAKMDSPDQGATGIVCNETTFVDNKLTIRIASLGANYEGTLQGDNIEGIFTQMGVKLPLDLDRNEIKKEELKRPQEPKPPFSYYTEEVSFVNNKDGVTLAGTLTLPDKKRKYPVVVLISGSGPQDRNEEIMGHKPFLVIADYLTRNGIGVLRYDDRGTAQSTGNFGASTTFDFANDVEVAVEFLLKRKDINTKKIGLIGHSEGGIIAPMVAARNKNVSYIVMLAGTGIRGEKLLLMQQKAISLASDIPEKAIMENEKLNKSMFEEIINSTDTLNLKTRLSAVLQKSINENTALKANLSPEQQNEVVQNTVAQLITPWMYEFIKYDPYFTLKKVKCPTLALNGSNDLQVPAKENLLQIRQAFNEGGNKKLKAVELQGLNHLFQESQTGLPSEYQTIEQTFSPKALEEILLWIKQR